MLEKIWFSIKISRVHKNRYMKNNLMLIIIIIINVIMTVTIRLLKKYIYIYETPYGVSHYI